MIYGLIFIIGLAVGSFLNVCIFRLPKAESIISPPSHCPHCKKLIPWYDNIPLISYLVLKRRCRFCKKRISFRYFLVELLTAVIFCLLFYKFGLEIKFFIYSTLVSGLIISTFVDFEHKIIPDEISVGGLVLGLALSFIFPSIHNVDVRFPALLESIKGAISGGALIYLLGVLGKILFKKESMGGGDVKLVAMIGSFLGWKLTLFIFFLAPIFGASFGLYWKFKKNIEYIPYGPFLSLSTVIAIFYGNQFIECLFRNLYI